MVVHEAVRHQEVVRLAADLPEPPEEKRRRQEVARTAEGRPEVGRVAEQRPVVVRMEEGLRVVRLAVELRAEGREVVRREEPDLKEEQARQADHQLALCCQAMLSDILNEPTRTFHWWLARWAALGSHAAKSKGFLGRGTLFGANIKIHLTHRNAYHNTQWHDKTPHTDTECIRKRTTRAALYLNTLFHVGNLIFRWYKRQRLGVERLMKQCDIAIWRVRILTQINFEIVLKFTAP